MSATSQCPHNDTHIHLNTHTSGDTPVRYLEVTGKCNICGAPMRFRCDVQGMLPTRPATGQGDLEIRLPFLFGEEQATGKENGFTVRHRS